MKIKAKIIVTFKREYYGWLFTHDLKIPSMKDEMTFEKGPYNSFPLAKMESDRLIKAVIRIHDHLDIEVIQRGMPS